MEQYLPRALHTGSLIRSDNFSVSGHRVQPCRRGAETRRPEGRSHRGHAVTPGAEPSRSSWEERVTRQTTTMGLLLGATDNKRSGAVGHVISGGPGATAGGRGKQQEEVQEVQHQVLRLSHPAEALTPQDGSASPARPPCPHSSPDPTSPLPGRFLSLPCLAMVLPAQRPSQGLQTSTRPRAQAP